MPHGTTIYFQHPDESSWRTQLASIDRLLFDFGASASDFYRTLGRKYTAELTNDFTFQPGDSETRHTGDLYGSFAFDAVELLEDRCVNQLETGYARPVRHFTDAQEEGLRSPSPASLDISLIYRPGFCSHEALSRASSRGVWRMDLEIALDPYWVQIDIEDARRYSYEEVWDYYELAKRIHREAGFTLSAGSFIENYYQFGESEGTRFGFDQLFRFDRNGPSRLILPYEERRPFLLELDENGDNELSIDRQTGLYKCVVPAGPVL